MNVIWDIQNSTDSVAKNQSATGDVVLMDIGATGLAQAEAESDFKGKYPDVKILTLGGLVVNDSFSVAEQFASYSYVYKNNGALQLEKAIVDLHKKEIKQELTPVKPGINNMPLPGTALTRREVEIIRMAAKEYNSGEIAAKLDINVRTVETHRKRIMAKTNCKNFIGVVIFALKNNYIHINDFS